MNPRMPTYQQYAQAQAQPHAQNPAHGRSPATARRPGQMPPGTHHAAAAQQAQAQAAQAAQAQILSQQMQQRNAAIEHQMAQRRARKPNDRNLPDGVEDVVIGETVAQYRAMRDAERKLDHAMMRKRMEIQDAYNPNVKRQKTMRIWVSNSADNQPWQRGGLDENAFDFNSGGDATYQVKIEGRVLDDSDDEEEDDGIDLNESNDAAEALQIDGDADQEMGNTSDLKNKQTSLKPPQPKFSHFFKAISVEHERSRQLINDPGPQIEWKKPRPSSGNAATTASNSADFDCMRFQRRGDENMNITIHLVRDEQPERFRLSQAVAATLDLEEANRAEVITGLWDYIRAMGLQEDEDRRLIRCDERLRQIFGMDSIHFPQISERIMPHLHPLPPIKLRYTVRVDETYISNPEPTIYDIKVLTDDPLQGKIQMFSQNPEHGVQLREIARLDDQLAVLVQAITHHKARHTFFRSMTRDPARFLQRWMTSQSRDLEVLLGELGKGDVAGLEFAKGGKDGVWNSEIVQEAVRYRLAKPDVVR